MRCIECGEEMDWCGTFVCQSGNCDVVSIDHDKQGAFCWLRFFNNGMYIKEKQVGRVGWLVCGKREALYDAHTLS